MTSKERWMAALRLEAVDRLPFWPKLSRAYLQAQSSPFREMDLDTVQKWIGSDDHTFMSWRMPSWVREDRKTTSLKVTEQGDLQITVFRSQSGQTKLIKRFDRASQLWYPIRFPVNDLKDVRVMREYFSDCSIKVDTRLLQEAKVHAKNIAGVSADVIGRSPLMYWVRVLANVENGNYLLADYREDIEALLEVLHKNLLKKTEIMCKYSPCDILYFIEDTNTTFISPEQFRKYCYRHILEYAHIAENAGRLLLLHMCGKLKALLPDLARLPVAGFEAFNSPPVGDIALLDGRVMCPNKCLIGGTNSRLWSQPAEKIIAKIEEDLETLPHQRGIVVTSAEIMTHSCKPETIREVCERVKRYPARM